MKMDVGRRPLVPRPPSPIPTTLPSPWPEPSPHHAVSVPLLLLLLLPISPPGSASFPSPPLDSPPPAGRPCWVLGLACAMDDGGEARLPRKKGKARRPPPPPAEREPGRGRDRFQSLWRDYHDLLQEAQAKKRRLESMNRRRLGLLAEVKFLRKKYSLFVKDDSQQTRHSLKKRKDQQIPSTLGADEGPSTSKNANLDLNQDSAMNSGGARCQAYQDHSEPGKHDPAGVDADMMNSNVNIPVYRDTGNSPASDDKRATAWQDRVALKV